MKIVERAAALQPQEASYTHFLLRLLPLFQEYEERDGKIIRPGMSRGKIRCHDGGCEQCHVTFVNMASDMRVMRLAAAARHAGLKTQLVTRRQTDSRSQKIRLVLPEYFDSIIHVEQEWGSMALYQALKAVHGFGSHLVHIVAQNRDNEIVTDFLKHCRLPVVGDAYDMVNVQYNPRYKKNTAWLPAQTRFERIWYQSVEGICFRSPYYNIMKNAGLRPKTGARISVLPEPLLDIAPHDRAKDRPKNILIFAFSENLQDELDSIADQIQHSKNKYFIIYIKRFCQGIIFNEKFNIIQEMSYSQYDNFLDSIDAYIQLPRNITVYSRYVKAANMSLSWRNSWPDMIERHIHIFIPKHIFRFVSAYYKKTHLIHEFGSDELLTQDFWNIRVNDILDTPAHGSIETFRLRHVGHKLEKFYQKILSGYSLHT